MCIDILEVPFYSANSLVCSQVAWQLQVSVSLITTSPESELPVLGRRVACLLGWMKLPILHLLVLQAFNKLSYFSSLTGTHISRDAVFFSS